MRFRDGSFALTIELGSDAMCEPHHIGTALYLAREQLLAGASGATISDVNGNTVGRWSIDATNDEPRRRFTYTAAVTVEAATRVEADRLAHDCEIACEEHAPGSLALEDSEPEEGEIE